MEFAAHFLASGYHPIPRNATDTDFSQEEGATTEFVRGRALLRLKAHGVVIKMRTDARPKGMITGGPRGTRNPLEEDAKVEYHPVEQPDGGVQW